MTELSSLAYISKNTIRVTRPGSRRRSPTSLPLPAAGTAI